MTQHHLNNNKACDRRQQLCPWCWRLANWTKQRRAWLWSIGYLIRKDGIIHKTRST